MTDDRLNSLKTHGQRQETVFGAAVSKGIDQIENGHSFLKFLANADIRR